MKITLLNGNPDRANLAFEEQLKKLVKHWNNEHDVNHIDLKELAIQYCTGCFQCWVKTPGQCVVNDDSDRVGKALIHSDLVIFASPIIMGFTSALLKQATDKLIPLVHPYITIKYGECHHWKRYKHYPDLGLLVQPGKDTDDEDLFITENIYRRLSRNFHSRLVFHHLISDSVELMDKSLQKAKKREAGLAGN